MSVRNLEKLLKPKRIAVVGASDRPGKVGYTLLQNMVGRGYEGVVYPVNPAREAVQGIAAWKRLGDLPHPPDLVVICTPAETVPGLIEECGSLGVPGAMIISAGFREVGAPGKAIEDQVKQAAARHREMRIVGPNCLGFMVPSIKLNASFAASMALPGRVAFLSQSGALCTSVLDWANAAGVGFSHFVSLGNMLDVGLDDLLDYLATDSATDSVVLYIESVTNVRPFMSAARAFSRDKPIIAYKAGRFADSAQAAASHTGALAGVDAVYEAAFRRAGMVRVFDFDEMFDCAELLARQRVPKGERLAIITNAGGPGVMACDALIERRGKLAKLEPSTVEKLNEVLPPFWSHGNPVDILGDAPPQRYADALRLVLADQNVDAVLVLLTPQAMTEPTASAAAVIEAAHHSTKPILAAWKGADSVREGSDRLHHAGIPVYGTAERAIRAFMRLLEYARNRELLYETPREVPLRFDLNPPALQRRFDEITSGKGTLLSEDDSKLLLSAYGIPVSLPKPAATQAEAAEIAEQIGYPVVLKVRSPQITHKTEVGGVALNLQGADEVRTAFARIVADAGRLRPDAELLGVTVQRMAVAANGVELILGMKRDPVFGPAVLCGFGGVAAEVFQDTALGLPPLNERLARRMLQSLRVWPLLAGHRGRPAVDVDRIIEILLRFSCFVAQRPELNEVDINPLLVTPDGALALDARIVIDQSPREANARPYSHLAISPYPEEFVRNVRLKDGSEIVVRPIRPEDEPMWQELLANSSPETIRLRFGYLFQAPTHQMATRFCVIDYDREMALVAELQTDSGRKITGVGRLIADADHQDAEFATLVGDPWQGRGIGSLLMNECLELCRKWGIRRVWGETMPENRRMLGMFQRRGFVLDRSVARDVVVVHKELSMEESGRGSAT